nr:MAG TPA: TerD-like protein [Herelleviridae sp.]
MIGYNTKTQEIETVWNVEVPEYYQTVANVMKDYVLSFIEKGKVESYFLTTERVAGHLSNTDNYDPTIIWDHFYAKIPSQYLVDKKDIGTVLGDQNTNYTLAKSSIDLISLDSLETILELIDQNSLYRGEEFESLVKSYLDFRKSLTNLSPTLVDMKCFELGIKKGGVARFKNTVIGTLATDLSEGVELDKAVASFESKVAPTNYKRTTALITPKMIKQAQETLEELGYADSIYRKFATDDDISLDDVLFTGEVKTATNVFEEMANETQVDLRTLSKVEEISYTDFVEKVLPKAKQVSVLFTGKQKSNLVSLIAPEHPSSANMFKWDNKFSWAYNGDVTDSIAERVKEFGGSLEGDLRISLNWHCGDDLDLHLIEADQNEIWYRNRGIVSRLGGMLDLDMNGLDKHDDENPVENIIYKKMPKDGVYKVVVNNYSKRSTKSNAFTIQVKAFDITTNFNYPLDTKTDRNVNVVKIHIKDGDVVKLETLNDHITTKAGIFTKIVANQSLDIDLDLALLTFTKDGFAEVINGFNTRSSDNAIYHYGDKTESQGDSEMISISFPVLNPKISHIAIVVTSAKGHKFNLLEQSTLNLRNQEGMLPLVSYNLQNGEEKSSCLIGILIKHSNCWEFQTIEDYSRETNPRDLKDLTLNWIKFIK